MENLKNPYYIRDEAGLTQALGWADAWTCEPSAYDGLFFVHHGVGSESWSADGFARTA